jgi:hypothetical protein
MAVVALGIALVVDLALSINRPYTGFLGAGGLKDSVVH